MNRSHHHPSCILISHSKHKIKESEGTVKESLSQKKVNVSFLLLRIKFPNNTPDLVTNLRTFVKYITPDDTTHYQYYPHSYYNFHYFYGEDNCLRNGRKWQRTTFQRSPRICYRQSPSPHWTSSFPFQSSFLKRRDVLWPHPWSINCPSVIRTYR